MSLRRVSTMTLAATLLCAGSAFAVPVELAVNGGFEIGTFGGWNLFGSSATNPITLVSPGATGTYAAYLNNNSETLSLVIRNTNIGIGDVVAGEVLTVSFDARGSYGIGGVAFAEVFSEIAGGGISKSVILGGAPLALDANPSIWKHFTFTTTAGPNVTAGVSLQLTATTAAQVGSTSRVYYDNASVTVDRTAVPVAGSTWGRLKQLYK